MHAGGDFTQLAKSFSDGPTAAEGGDLGQYKQGQLPKVLEDKTFGLNTGQYTDPILTRQGYIILKVAQHTPGGPRAFKDVEEQVEQDYYMTRMEPAIRDYLNHMRDNAFIWLKQGYVDSRATPGELHSSISFSAYTPPEPKKKGRVERTRFRESTHTFRQKSGTAATATDQTAANQPPAETKKGKNEKAGTEKPGKKEKIRYGQSPRETLPTATSNAATENAGAVPETASNTDQPVNPLEPTAPTRKTRFSARARESKKNRSAPAVAPGPAPPDAAEVADRQTQSAPLEPSSDNTAQQKEEKDSNATAEKTRLQNQKKQPTDSSQQPQQPTPIPPVPGAPAPTQQQQPQPPQP